MAIGIFVAALALYIAAGVWVSRKVKDSDDFLVMDEKGSTLLIVGTLAATYLSAVTMLGIAGVAYSEGPLVLVISGSFGAWLGTLLAVVYIGRRFKSIGCRTMPDFFRDRFNNKAVTIVATIIMIIGLIGYGVIQLIGAGLVLSEITGISFPILIILFTLALLVFSALGGMYGVVVTDTLMFFTMLTVSVVIAPLIISKVGFGPMRDLSETLPGYWTTAGTNNRPFGFTASQFLVWIIFFTCAPALVSRVFPARNDFVVLKAAIIGVFLVPVMQLTVFLAAAAMRVIEPSVEQPDNIMVLAFLEHVPPVLGGIGLAALMAAIMSTSSTLFVLAGFGLSHDLYENLRKGEISEADKMRAGRLAQIAIAVVVAGLAIMRPAAIYWISIYAGAIFGVGWLPTVVAGLEWRKMNARAALGSMGVGVAGFIVITELVRAEILTLPTYLDPLIIAFALSVAALVLVALMTKPTEHENRQFLKIRKASASKQTIEEVLKSPNGLEILKREYRQIYMLAIGAVILAAGLWGYMFYNLGM